MTRTKAEDTIPVQRGEQGPRKAGITVLAAGWDEVPGVYKTSKR